MRVLVILVVSCHMLVINGLDTTVCKNGGNFPSVNLNCSNNDTIHVENITYFYKQGPGCGSSTGICGQPLTNSDTGLISCCTGQPLPCQQAILNYSNCTGSTVNYRCIPRENGQDMCQSKINLTENAGRIFLLSPNYPDFATGFKPNEPSCHCVIRATNITNITILDLVLRTGSDGTRSNLLIQYGDITYNKTSRENSQSTLQVYNHRLQSSTSKTSTAVIIFTHQQINQQKLWIEIQGLSLAGFCNNIPATTVTPTPSTPFTSPPQPDSTTTPGTSPSSTGTATHTSTDTSTSSETSTVHPTTDNITDSSTTITSNTSSETQTETSELPSGSTSRTSTNPPELLAEQTGNDNKFLVVGSIVGGLVFTFILVAVCVLVGIRRKRANILQQNVHVHINNTTNTTVNNTTPSYFVLENMNTQDVEVKHDDNRTNPASVATGRTPEYAVVNKTGRGFNVADVNKPDHATKSNATGVSDMEILENELYIPYEAPPSNVTDVNPPDPATKSNATGVSDMEILENELYIPYEASNNPDNTGAVASTTNNTTQHGPSGDMEIMENDLYVPFEESAVEVSKPTKNGVYDNAVECGTQQDVAAPEMKIGTKQNVATPEMEILENDLYVPFEDTDKVAYDNAHKDANKPSDQAPVMEILENDLYVPFEKTQIKFQL